MKNIHYILILLVLFSSSCTTKKQVLYIQDIESNRLYQNSYENYKLKKDDILKIDIFVDDLQSTELINQFSANVPITTKEAFLLNGHQINDNGYIDLPQIGLIKSEGKTIYELREDIYNSLVQGNFLVNPNVDVKLINSHFTILGEINMPGRYDFLENNLNILEAIGYAGDLTINGQRDNIKLIRENGGKKEVYEIDLTNSKFMEDKYYQVMSGDIIIVNQNYNRVKNAGIIGNSGTLLSLLSFVLSSFIVLGNN